MEHVWVGWSRALKTFWNRFFKASQNSFKYLISPFGLIPLLRTYESNCCSNTLYLVLYTSANTNIARVAHVVHVVSPVQCIRCHPLPTNGNCRILERSDWKGSRLNITMMSIMNDDWYINSIFLNPWQDLDCCDDGILIPADVGVGGHEDGQGNLGIGIIISSFNHWEPSHLLGPFISRSLC